MAKVKAYTQEQVSKMASMYTGADNKAEVAAIAAELGKSAASVRAKLASEGLYVKAEVTKAEGTKKTTKADIAAEIAAKTGMNEVEAEALTKTTASVLNKLLSGLTN